MEVEENSGRKLNKGMECSKYDGVVLVISVFYSIGNMRYQIHGFVSEGG